MLQQCANMLLGTFSSYRENKVQCAGLNEIGRTPDCTQLQSAINLMFIVRCV